MYIVFGRCDNCDMCANYWHRVFKGGTLLVSYKSECNPKHFNIIEFIRAPVNFVVGNWFGGAKQNCAHIYLDPHLVYATLELARMIKLWVCGVGIVKTLHAYESCAIIARHWRSVFRHYKFCKSIIMVYLCIFFRVASHGGPKSHSC